MSGEKRVKITMRNGIFGYAVYIVRDGAQDELCDYLPSFELVHQRHPDASFAGAPGAGGSAHFPATPRTKH